MTVLLEYGFRFFIFFTTIYMGIKIYFIKNFQTINTNDWVHGFTVNACTQITNNTEIVDPISTV